MYLSHYKLRIKPFQITTDPKFLWLGEKHKEALATLEYGIKENKGFLLLTGDVGTGKTALINQLITMVDLESRIAAIPDPGLEKLDFFNFLAEQFGMAQKFSAKGEFLIKFKKYLHDADAKGKKVLLIIDEAQRLNHELLEEIRLLSNIELNDKKLINIFFVGQNEFNHMLMDPQSRAVRQRISVRYDLDPLDRAETEVYIKHRLKVAGAKRNIFTSEAIKEIHGFADGNPRLINIICDHALLTGYSKDIKEINAEIIKECAKDLRIPAQINQLKRTKNDDTIVAPTPIARPAPPAKQNQFSIPYSYILIVTLAVVIAGYLLYQERKETGQQFSIEDLVPSGPQGAPSEQDILDEPDSQVSLAESEPSTENQNDESIPSVIEVGEFQSDSTTGQETPILNLDKVQKIIVYFGSNSNELPATAYETLDQFAAALRKEKNAQISVKGYADSSGTPGYNKSMSTFRANIIKSYLVGKGIDPAAISSEGLGATNPIAPNTTPQGRQRNRRVEIEFDLASVNNTE
jgi:general secretion pathway protein A